eukprot:NODE_19417_length_844_cov_2.170153.p2 GENE.NODE_19417_length_844_cov_2.170153~~NODE_19417_length_844_cov_2.170153.p2  ORF type:complete len:119 (+),score=54.47 NODE_19417_length_844_cov_2.170153:30-359(+)
MQPVLEECMQALVEKHACVSQGRAIGLFGCLDLVLPDGSPVQNLQGPSPDFVNDFRAAYRANGLFGLVRAPLLHCCPPLTISEEELRDGFERLSKALEVLDAGIATAHA